MTTSTARPDFLTPENAARFADAGVAEAYPHRPPYAPDVVDVLVGLVVGEPRSAAVLDLGAGTGNSPAPSPRALAPSTRSTPRDR